VKFNVNKSVRIFIYFIYTSIHTWMLSCAESEIISPGIMFSFHIVEKCSDGSCKCVRGLHFMANTNLLNDETFLRKV
jgi:hypothetical protein